MLVYPWEAHCLSAFVTGWYLTETSETRKVTLTLSLNTLKDKMAKHSAILYKAWAKRSNERFIDAPDRQIDFAHSSSSGFWVENLIMKRQHELG